MLRIRSTLAALGAAAALGALPASLQAQFPSPQTFYWGSGLIDIPTAWVSPITGDFSISYSGKQFRADPNAATKINYSNNVNSQLVMSMSFLGRVEAGFAAFSSNPEYGFFGKALLLREDDFRARGGAGRWIPGLAVGIRNVGPYEHIDRFGIGYSLLPPDSLSPNYRHVADSLHTDFSTANSMYAVATKSFSLSDIRPSWPNFNLGVTLGFGNGLFSDDGGLGDAYAKHKTGGLFYGVKTDWQASPSVSMMAMAEHNAWDFNLGVAALWRGIQFAVYATELGSGGEAEDTLNPATFAYNYTKVGFNVSWHSNIFALLKGDFLQNYAARLERERAALLAEINTRQQRIAALELEINRYEAQNLLELEQRRAQAEAQLRSEREALERLEQRLRRVEQQQPPPPTPPR